MTRQGGAYNGTTWFDSTNYFETFPADEGNLAGALDIEADRMVNSYVSAEDLGSETTVVRNERERVENSPSGLWKSASCPRPSLWHNYGKFDHRRPRRHREHAGAVTAGFGRLRFGLLHHRVEPHDTGVRGSPPRCPMWGIVAGTPASRCVSSGERRS